MAVGAFAGESGFGESFDGVGPPSCPAAAHCCRPWWRQTRRLEAKIQGAENRIGSRPLQSHHNAGTVMQKQVGRLTENEGEEAEPLQDVEEVKLLEGGALRIEE